MKDPLSGWRAVTWYFLGGLVGVLILTQILK